MKQSISSRDLGVIGERHVNVLPLNQALERVTSTD